ncbi:alpha,alpha-trehalose-phosphate synthase, partial [Burkholderia contaminans]
AGGGGGEAGAGGQAWRGGREVSGGGGGGASSRGRVGCFGAVEKLLEHERSHRNRVSFRQSAPSTRAELRAYQDIRLQLEGESGRINGRFAEPDWAPILYIHRQHDRQLLAAPYRLARVGYVTPPRDCMNLVPNESVSDQHPRHPRVPARSPLSRAPRAPARDLIVKPAV